MRKKNENTRENLPWAESQSGGHFATPFSEESLGVSFGLPSRLNRLAELPWFNCYEMQLASEKKSKHTLRSYRTSLKQFITTVLPGEMPASYDALQNMTVKELARWIDPNNGRLDFWVQSISNLSPATINARMAAIGHLMAWIGHRVPDWITRPKKGRSLPKTLAKKEIERLKEAAATSENPFAHLVITLLLDTGMRVSELCALNRADVDIDDFSATVVEGKGSKDRLILFTNSTVDSIEAYQSIRNEIVVRHPPTDEHRDALILNRRGRRLTPRAVQKLMDSMADSADIPRSKLSPHTLRHNFATGLLERGADLVSIQRLLGHANISATRIYLEISDQSLRQIYHRAQSAMGSEQTEID
ncbi:MAG: tyrosine-type recombinase/integrase [Candidatus Thalassarchaeaceae archaeon]|nr:tyrosine-type recombinase/integrase [Candidatus Thalassarchaeaceae archaeon]